MKSETSELSPRIINGPVADAYTQDALVFASEADEQKNVHLEDRKLLGTKDSTEWERLNSRYRIPGTGGEIDAAKLTESIRSQLREDPSRIARVLEIELTANPKLVCEIVKAVMEASEDDQRHTVLILETVASIIPESLRLAAQCAIAVDPSALQTVQSTLARLDPGAGDGSSAKTAKGAKAEALAVDSKKFSNRFGDPLDTPTKILIPPLDPDPWTVPEISESDPPLLD